MRSILAVIDLQNVFATPASEWFTPRFAEVLPPIHRLVDAFGDDVVFTRFIAPARPEGAWKQYYEQWPFALRPPDAPLYQVISEFEPKSTVDATTFGKWTPAWRRAWAAPGWYWRECRRTAACCRQRWRRRTRACR